MLKLMNDPVDRKRTMGCCMNGRNSALYSGSDLPDVRTVFLYMFAAAYDMLSAGLCNKAACCYSTAAFLYKTATAVSRWAALLYTSAACCYSAAALVRRTAPCLYNAMAGVYMLTAFLCKAAACLYTSTAALHMFAAVLYKTAAHLYGKPIRTLLTRAFTGSGAARKDTRTIRPTLLNFRVRPSAARS